MQARDDRARVELPASSLLQTQYTIQHLQDYHKSSALLNYHRAQSPARFIIKPLFQKCQALLLRT